MIKPTLFIGLGTTGIKILKSLRQLIFEEYGQEGLSIFRYVAIETDGAVDGTDGGLIDGIQVIRATIPATAPISNKLDPTQPESVYNEHLEKWLNPELLNYISTFMAGAANIRMAGRLCLWENWDVVNQTLDGARMAISAPDTMQKALTTLTDHYQAKGQPVPDDGPIDSSGVNVYIVGSLCGGSCSGMLIDVAYFCRHLLGTGATKNVYGIFTMFDEGQAAGTNVATSVRAANCFAALWELNYYNHVDTTYNITFPSGHEIRTSKTPFDYAKFVSRRNMTGGIFAKDGKFDEDGLNLMVALNLFADTAGDTDGQKAAILADGVGFPGIGGLKAVPKGEIPVMVRAMASFGLTAVWYPKYRIASAAAYSISKNLCGNWLETHVDMAVIVDQAKKEWNTILNENIDALTSPKRQLPLKQRIENDLGKVVVAFNSTSSTDQLKNRMEIFPPGPDGSFRNRFAPSGAYFELINMQVPVCQKAFCDMIEQVFNTQLSKIDFTSTYGLGDVRAFFSELDKEIEKYIEMLPSSLPALNLNQLNFDLMHSAEKNNWTKLIFLQHQSVSAEREKLIENYRKLIFEDNNRESIYQNVRNYFLRPVLQAVRVQLGFGVPGDDGDVTIRRKLDTIEANLKSCVNQFNESYESSIDQPSATAIKIVTNNPLNSVDEDANALSTKILKMDTRTELLNGASMATFLVKEHQDIMIQMIETYRRLSLEQIPVKNVVEQVQNILAAGGPGAIEIKNLAERSDAYQNFIPGYVGFNFAPPLKIISGHDPTEGDNLLTTLQTQFLDMSGNLKFPRIGSSSVDHLLFFYHAESGFALDDMASYEMLKTQFEKSPGPYGHLTHQDPNFYDLALNPKTQKLERWCRALAPLVPAVCSRIGSDAFAGLFLFYSGRYVYEYPVDGLPKTLGLYDDRGGIKELSQRKNDAAYGKFVEAVHSKFAHLNRETIISVIIELLKDVGNLDNRNTLSEFYSQFLADVYRDHGFVANPLSAEVKDLDVFFFREVSEASQDTDTQHFHLEGEDTKVQTSSMEATSTTQSENVTDPDVSTNTDDYHEITSETEVIEREPDTTQQTVGTSSTDHYEEVVETEETFSFSEDIPSQNNAADENENEFVMVETKPETEPSPEDSTVEEPFNEQQLQPEIVPETDEQKKQAHSSKEFSVADVDLKQVQRRGSTRKKE